MRTESGFNTTFLPATLDAYYNLVDKGAVTDTLVNYNRAFVLADIAASGSDMPIVWHLQTLDELGLSVDSVRTLDSTDRRELFNILQAGSSAINERLAMGGTS